MDPPVTVHFHKNHPLCRRFAGTYSGVFRNIARLRPYVNCGDNGSAALRPRSTHGFYYSSAARSGRTLLREMAAISSIPSP